MFRLILIATVMITLAKNVLWSEWELINSDIGNSAVAILPMEYIEQTGKIHYADGKFFYYSTNFGETWLKDTNTLTQQAISMARKDSTIILSCNKIISVVRSTDMGKTWHPRIEGLGSGDSSKLIHSVLAVKDSFAFLGTLKGIMRSSINGNDNWVYINNFVGLEEWKTRVIPKTFLIIDDKIFVGTISDGIWVSTDNGESWYKRNNGLSFMAVYDLQYFDGYMYAGTFGGGVCRSSNYGETWERISPKELPGLNRINRVYAEGNVILASSADNFGNYISKNFGKTWSAEPYSIQQYLTTNICSFLRLNEYLYAMFSYYGFYRIRWNDLITSISDDGINCIIFPNPARSVTRISLQQQGDVSISAVDMLGRSFPLWSGFATAGDMELDVSLLPTGAYTLLINYGTRVEAVKLINN